MPSGKVGLGERFQDSGKGLLMTLIYVLCIAVYSVVTLSALNVC